MSWISKSSSCGRTTWPIDRSKTVMRPSIGARISLVVRMLAAAALSVMSSREMRDISSSDRPISESFVFRLSTVVLQVFGIGLSLPQILLRDAAGLAQLAVTIEQLARELQLRFGPQQIELHVAQVEAFDLGQHLPGPHRLAMFDQDVGDAASDCGIGAGLFVGRQFDLPLGDDGAS